MLASGPGPVNKGRERKNTISCIKEVSPLVSSKGRYAMDKHLHYGISSISGSTRSTSRSRHTTAHSAGHSTTHSCSHTTSHSKETTMHSTKGAPRRPDEQLEDKQPVDPIHDMNLDITMNNSTRSCQEWKFQYKNHMCIGTPTRAVTLSSTFLSTWLISSS
jgi:hypothetical protein